MSDEKSMESTSADELAKTKQPGEIQLNEEDLKDVSGGKVHFSDISIVKVVDKTSP